jgi:hypothetical protein
MSVAVLKGAEVRPSGFGFLSGFDIRVSGFNRPDLPPGFDECSCQGGHPHGYGTKKKTGGLFVQGARDKI